MILRPYVLCDIDHTISNAFPRDPMIGGEGGWDAYHEASANDEPLHDMIALINALHFYGHTIIGLTARPAKFRALTTRWLSRHGVTGMGQVLMRADEEFRPSAIMKLELAREHFGNDDAIREKVGLVIEDRDDVAAAFRGIGVTVLQCFGRQK